MQARLETVLVLFCGRVSWSPGSLSTMWPKMTLSFKYFFKSWSEAVSAVTGLESLSGRFGNINSVVNFPVLY